MDARDVARSGAAVERKRQETRRMRASLRVSLVALRVKARERAMLRRKKKALLAEKAAMQRVENDLMDLLKANEQNGAGNAQDFDEKAMTEAILNLMISDDGGHGGENGEPATDFGDTVHETGRDLEAKATVDVILAKKDSEDGSGDNNDGLSGYNGSTDDGGDAGGRGGSDN